MGIPGGSGLHSRSLFRGADLQRVEPDGRTRLPAFVRRALGVEVSELILSLHEHSTCLSGYDTSYEARLADDIERRRLRDEDRGASPGLHDTRLHRAFAAAAEAEVGADGECRLPPMLRKRGGIGELALFVGTGRSFEIWNPTAALEAEDEVLRGLAADMLALGAGEEKEESQ